MYKISVPLYNTAYFMRGFQVVIMALLFYCLINHFILLYRSAIRHLFDFLFLIKTVTLLLYLNQIPAFTKFPLGGIFLYSFQTHMLELSVIQTIYTSCVQPGGWYSVRARCWYMAGADDGERADRQQLPVWLSYSQTPPTLIHFTNTLRSMSGSWSSRVHSGL